MRAEFLNQEAEKAGSRYSLLLAGFRSAFLTATPGLVQQGIDRSRVELTDRAYGLARDWLEQEAGILRNSLRDVADQAAVQTLEDLQSVYSELPEEAVNHLGGIADALDAAIRLQIERDIGILVGTLRETALRTALAARARGVVKAGALPPMREDAAGRLRFEFQDRAGKRWPSERHFRVIWRQAMLYAWNETALILMAEHGLEQAAVAHPDQGHAGNGALISLTEIGPGESWPDVRDEFFHPNSHAYVKVP